MLFPMVLSVANYKGGVGKTTTAMHLAALMATTGPTALVDSDATRTASKWGGRAEAGTLPFQIILAAHLAREARHYEHLIIDQEANPDASDFAELATGCDLMIVPTTPSEPAADGLAHTLDRIQSAGGAYRILLTIVPPPPSRSGQTMRQKLEWLELPIFEAEIPRLIVFDHLSSAGRTAQVNPLNPTETRAHGCYRAVWEEVRQWQNSLR